MWIRKGVKLLEDKPGDGPPVERQQYYLMAIRITLNQGEVVRHPEKCLSHQVDEHLVIEDDGFFRHYVRIDRENLIGGMFYTVQGMKIGGYRKVAIAPHLACGKSGIPNIIPPNAKLTAEIRVLKKMCEGHRDREEPCSSPLPHHAAYGSVLRGSADPRWRDCFANRQNQIQGNESPSNVK